MGVPAFFRWLCRKYPLVITPCVEEKARSGKKPDSTGPNPNGIEFDNLYLDMNGIIHPCTHPEDRPAPQNEDEMMIAIFDAIDRLFHIVRPRRLLYMAIDGVAPRAKMNQQRSRRFRASKETAEKYREMARIREELRSRGVELPPEKGSGEHFDSNCITPGTPFMTRLSECLHYYVHDRLTNNPAWAGIKVILSDASAPGEGEHKIQDYIRKQRAQPDHDPNTQHVLCGADADLIMLGLATHEPNFTIIREELKPNAPRPCELCGQKGHEMQECEGLSRQKSGDHDEIPEEEVPSTEFIYVRLSVLREYLQKELEMPSLPFPYDFERVVDDWVFMCFFVGNDFLPHLPSLEIREGAIDRLVKLYKDCVYKTGGWLTESGFFKPSRVQLIMNELGKVEDTIFKDRQQMENRRKQQDKARKRAKSDSSSRPSYIPGGQFAPTAVGSSVRPLMNPHQSIQQSRTAAFHQSANQSAAADLKSFLTGSSDATLPLGSDSSPHGQKRKQPDDEDEETPDEVRLYEDGFKDRYYESKFHVGADNLEFREHVGHEYVLGLAWVLQYYYQGCPSWEWYFPYHYAPFASDFTNISDLKTDFPKDTVPFTPLQQLMAVFPAASRNHVPKPWGELMMDPESDIADFYPSDFMIDLNGKKFAWQGVALLPFVEEKRLKETLAQYHHTLTDAEIKRNTRGEAILYTGLKHKSYSFLRALYTEQLTSETPIDAKEFEGMGGTILLSSVCIEESGTLDTPVNGLSNIYGAKVVSVSYRDPAFDIDYVYKSEKLPNAKTPAAQLKSQDLEKVGRPFRGGFRGGHNMGPRTHQASVGQAGHRMIGFQMQSQDRRPQQGGYGNQGGQGNSWGQAQSHYQPPRAQGYSSSGYQQPPQQSAYGQYGYNTVNSYTPAPQHPRGGGYHTQQQDRRQHSNSWEPQQSRNWDGHRNDRGGRGDGGRGRGRGDHRQSDQRYRPY